MSKRRKKNKKIEACGLAVSTLLLLSPVTALAAQAPDAGSTLEGLKPPKLHFPQKPAAEVQVEEANRPPAKSDSSAKFMVNGFHITGQNVFDEPELLKLVAEAKGKEASLADLEKVAKRITDYYREHGYITARAYIPAQRVEKGIVEIVVSTGRYDKIIIRKHTDISEVAIRQQLGAVKSGAFIEKTALERAIWLIDDLSGVEAKATLAPGSKAGTSDLILDISARPKDVLGSVTYSNFGNRFTGKNEVSTAITVLNPDGQGDQFSFYGVTAGSGLISGSISYQLPTAHGGKLEFGYSRMRYELGDDFASLDASGTANIISAAYDYTFKRSRRSNLYGKIGFAHKKLQDTASSITTDKQSNVVTLSFSGDNVDTWGGGGVNSFSLSYSDGHLAATDANSVQADTPGEFGKWNMTLARQQYINKRLSLLTVFNGQLATKNLDSSEKMSLGGAYGVRAYPRGEAAGDNAYILTNELRWTIPVKKSSSGVLQFVAFHDVGSALINKNPWSGMTGTNHRTLQGVGVGLNWIEPGNCTVKVSYAWKIGSEAAVSDTDKSGRLWLTFTKHF